jgi:ferredoxin-NADP reductase
LVGGGIGITPVLSMAKALVRRPDAPECWLFVGNRDRRGKLFAEELEALKAAGVKVVLCHSQPEADERPGLDHDEAGRVSLDLLRRLLPDERRRFHLCGPPAMMADLVAGLEAWGVADSDILYEAFGPATVKRASESTSSAGRAETETAEVVFAKSGKTRQWTSAAGSLLDLAEAAGIALEAGCRAGNCGTCAIPLVEGEVSYLSPPGEPPEEGSCLPCVCVPQGRVVVQS